MHFACMRQTKPAVAHKSVGHVLPSASRGGGSMHFACMCQTEPAVARESVGAGMSSSSSASLPRCPFGLTLR